MSRKSFAPRIQVKRVYEAASQADGTRILVERLWPRGMTKAGVVLDGWMKQVAPSQQLRKWYGHDPARWEQFRRRYVAELDRGGAWIPLRDLARERGLTLLYSVRDQQHNSAVVLRDYLMRRLTSGSADDPG